MKLSNNPLNRPFPDREFGRDTLVGMARVSLFVFFALYFLRPLGFNAAGNLALVCLGYGLVTFLVATTYAWTTERLLGWQRSGVGWTLGKWILDCGILLVFISAGNFVYYNWLVGWTAFSSIVLAYVALPTVLIGLFPIAFSGMAIQLRAERDNSRTAASFRLDRTRTETSGLSPRLVMLGEGGLAVDPAGILFCESRQNYLRCVFLTEGQTREETIRATINSVEAQLVGAGVIRCHRSYLVNPAHIRQASGNAQGLRLEMVATSEEVPVSRAYVASLREVTLG